MSSLQDLINLAKADGGKFFVIDETGEAKLVIMGLEEYQRLLLGKLQRQVQDVESINREILKAQLLEQENANSIVTPKVPSPRVSSYSQARRPDLREEVIDPSFDFEAPKVTLEDI